MASIKYIKNPPSIEDLENLLNSNVYKTLLNSFEEKTGIYFLEERDKTALWNILANIKRNYLLLNISIEEVKLEFEQHTTALLNYTVNAFYFFNNFKNNKQQDGEFPEGEKPSKDERSKIVKYLGLTKTLFLIRFCEFYLLKTNDKERLSHYLKLLRMPYAKKHQTIINKLYKEVIK